MRDLDLVVSVAHAGGVDPEATASTTEMRAALIREAARPMRLRNIGFAGEHVLIDGLFLPFADDDPKTAEIVAKVLMLARDQEIKDPAILEQLRS